MLILLIFYKIKLMLLILDKAHMVSSSGPPAIRNQTAQVTTVT